MPGFWALKICRDLPGGGVTRIHLSTWRVDRTPNLQAALAKFKKMDLTDPLGRYDPEDPAWYPCVFYMPSADEVSEKTVINEDPEEGPVGSQIKGHTIAHPDGFDGVPVDLEGRKRARGPLR